MLTPASQKDLSFDSFFTHILAHELSHGIGPHQITVGGRATTPRQELKELYSAIEEAKADVTGLFMLQHLYDQKLIDGGPDMERKLYTTFLASTFRTLRFGLKDAHGKGMAMQVNYITDKGGFVAHPDGTFEVNFDKIKPAVRDLDHDLLTHRSHRRLRAAPSGCSISCGVIRPQDAESARTAEGHSRGHRTGVRDRESACADGSCRTLSRPASKYRCRSRTPPPPSGTQSRA